MVAQADRARSGARAATSASGSGPPSLCSPRSTTKIDDHPEWFIVDNGTQGFTIHRDFAGGVTLKISESA
jgi:hypothetical protein